MKETGLQKAKMISYLNTQHSPKIEILLFGKLLVAGWKNKPIPQQMQLCLIEKIQMKKKHQHVHLLLPRGVSQFWNVIRFFDPFPPPNKWFKSPLAGWLLLISSFSRESRVSTQLPEKKKKTLGKLHI